MKKSTNKKENIKPTKEIIDEWAIWDHWTLDERLKKFQLIELQKIFKKEPSEENTKLWEKTRKKK